MQTIYAFVYEMINQNKVMPGSTHFSKRKIFVGSWTLRCSLILKISPKKKYLKITVFIFQTYTCDVFFAQSWKDNRLRLPDNMTSEYRLLPIEWLTEIWRPDSFFKNAKSVTFQTMTIPNHYIWLWKDKTILYMVK